LATKLGMAERILFTGFRSDVPDCLAAFDVFVLPSFAESHSIGLLEAMRAGKPIVATGVGGNTESVRDGREAIIVPPGDATALAEALSRLLGDSSARERLRQAARQRFESEFSLERMLRRTAEWLMACGAMAREEQASLPAGRQSP
jgi:glycosyltransferase involved in cell wall biosynthesis